MAKGDIHLMLSGAQARKATDLTATGGRGGPYNTWTPGLPSGAIGHARIGAGYSIVSGVMPPGVVVEYCRTRHDSVSPVIATVPLRYVRSGTYHSVEAHNGTSWQSIAGVTAANAAAANGYGIADVATAVAGVFVRISVAIVPANLPGFSGSFTSDPVSLSIAAKGRATPERFLQSGIVSPQIPVCSATGNYWWPADFLPYGGFDFLKAWGVEVSSGFSIAFSIDTSSQEIAVRMATGGSLATYYVPYGSATAGPVFVGPASRICGAMFYLDPAAISLAVSRGLLVSDYGSFKPAVLIASADWYALPYYTEDYADWGHRQPFYLHNPWSVSKSVTLRGSGLASPSTIYGDGYPDDSWYVGLAYTSTDPVEALAGFYGSSPQYLSSSSPNATLSFTIPAGAYVPIWRHGAVGVTPPAPGTRGTLTLYIGD